MSLTESDDCSNKCDERHKSHNSFVRKEIFQCLLLRFNSNLKEESTFYKKVVITFVIFVDVVFSFCILNN